MTPDVEAQLLNGLTNLNEVMGDVREDLAAMKAAQESHAEMHALHSEVRAATCPTRPLAEKAIRDSDAIAGILRTEIGRIDDHETRLLVLEAYNRAKDKSGAVQTAVLKERLRPVRWVWDNIVKIAAALLALFVTSQAMAIGQRIDAIIDRLFH